MRRFQQEAHAAANLTHPNIVTVHDIGQDDHRHYIVMEFVDGQTLKQLIREQAQNHSLLPINRSLDLAIQTCNGLGYAHRAQLVHCDMKPQNILVTRDDRVKVADFGIARAISEASQQISDSQVWGTPQYFSPEQAAGEAPTPASDVYGVGVIMFEMLTGHLPFTADTPHGPGPQTFARDTPFHHRKQSGRAPAVRPDRAKAVSQRTNCPLPHWPANWDGCCKRTATAPWPTPALSTPP
ncbi:MAG: protein kinase [Chloroflexi bacterium]|nr:protein kinase [Chloroflexota bacterium]